MRIHAIMCTYLGDGELDIGKTARWVQNFVDSVFFYDSSGSRARFYAIDYAKTFPDCRYAYHPVAKGTMLTDPATVRQMAFQAADQAWGFAPEDWVIYVDGTEGLTVDLPHDSLELLSPTSLRFRYLYDEVAAAPRPYLGLPFATFLHQGAVTEHKFMIDPTWGDVAYNIAVWWACDPHYLDDARQLLRFAQVAWLRTATPDNFMSMDTFNYQTYSTAQQVALVSYSYARWAPVSASPAQENLGFQNRLYMQQVPGRNIPELPVDFYTDDPVGLPVTVPLGPARIFVYDNTADEYLFNFEGHVTTESGNETYNWDYGDGSPLEVGQRVEHTFPAMGTYTVALSVDDPDASGPRLATVIIEPNTMAPITPQEPTVGLPVSRLLSPPYTFYVNQARNEYVTAFGALWRKNPRDGVWYQDMTIGPVPVDPITGDPAVPPSDWDAQLPNVSPPGATAPNVPGPGDNTIVYAGEDA